MIKCSIWEEDTTIINIYAPNIGVPQYVRQILKNINREINSNRIIVGDFNIPLSLDRKLIRCTDLKWQFRSVGFNWYL